MPIDLLPGVCLPAQRLIAIAPVSDRPCLAAINWDLAPVKAPDEPSIYLYIINMSDSGNLSNPAAASGSEAAPRKQTLRRVAEMRQTEDQKSVKKALDEMWEHRAEDMKKWTDMEAKMEADTIAHAHDEDVSGLKAELERLKKTDKRKCCVV